MLSCRPSPGVYMVSALRLRLGLFFYTGSYIFTFFSVYVFKIFYSTIVIVGITTIITIAVVLEGKKPFDLGRTYMKQYIFEVDSYMLSF